MFGSASFQSVKKPLEAASDSILPAIQCQSFPRGASIEYRLARLGEAQSQ
jgi:hypothetical protein